MPSITSRFHRALNMAEESIVPKGQQLLSMLDAAAGGEVSMGEDSLKPVDDKDFKQFLNKVGEVVKPRELRLAVYQVRLSFKVLLLSSTTHA